MQLSALHIHVLSAQAGKMNFAKDQQDGRSQAGLSQRLSCREDICLRSAELPRHDHRCMHHYLAAIIERLLKSAHRLSAHDSCWANDTQFVSRFMLCRLHEIVREVVVSMLRPAFCLNQLDCSKIQRHQQPEHHQAIWLLYNVINVNNC